MSNTAKNFDILTISLNVIIILIVKKIIFLICI